jgi:hypothetical protein
MIPPRYIRAMFPPPSPETVRRSLEAERAEIVREIAALRERYDHITRALGDRP